MVSGVTCEVAMEGAVRAARRSVEASGAERGVEDHG